MTSTAPLTPTQQNTLLSLPGNSLCAECSTPNPSWTSLSYGITLCLDCAGLHRGLGVHLSFVRSLTMDDFTDEQFAQMMRGGNDKWKNAWKEGNATAEFRERQSWKEVRDGTKERGEMRDVIKAKYESDTAKLYRDLIASGDGAKTNNVAGVTSASVKSETVTLAAEQPPTLAECQAITFPFTISLLFSEPKGFMSLIMWIICGIGLGSWVNKFGPESFVNILVPSIIGLTGFVPYYFVSQKSNAFASGWVNHRSDAFKSAKNLLVELITKKKARRLDSCDVYYPTTKVERKANVGLVFYPGALVDRTAYAPIASKLADAGVFVVIANLEPFRLVTSLKSFNTKERVMKMISDSLLLEAEDGGGLWEVEEWAIGGHSAGGSLAIATCANEMYSTMKKVVLWGVGSYPHPAMYPCKALRDVTSDVDVLLLNGSNDNIAKAFGANSASNEMEAKLPPKAEATQSKSGQGRSFYITIEGGNHSGCAHYGPQTYPMRDGDRTITLEEQQDQTAKLTVDFLFGNYGKLSL